MIRVLVTGAGGQLGRCIQQVSSLYSQLKIDFADKNTLDIVSKEDVNSLFSINSYDFCINCAAYTNVEQAEKTPEIAFSVNAEGVKNLALACKINRIKLIHISTDYVFDGEKKEGYLPTDLPDPINEYGKSKLKGEQYIQEILHNYIIIRTSWLYSDYGHNFYKSILAKAQKGETLYVTDDQVGCPTDANHLASFILDFVQKEQSFSGIVHFTDKKVMTWYDFAVSILKKHKLDNHVEVVRDKNYRSFARRPAYSILIDA